MALRKRVRENPKGYKIELGVLGRRGFDPVMWVMRSQKSFMKRSDFLVRRPTWMEKTLMERRQQLGLIRRVLMVWKGDIGLQRRQIQPVLTTKLTLRMMVLGRKPFHWQFSYSKDFPITEDQDSVAHLVRNFKPAGCMLPSLWNTTEREVYVKMVVAHAKVQLYYLGLELLWVVYFHTCYHVFKPWKLTTNLQQP